MLLLAIFILGTIRTNAATAPAEVFICDKCKVVWVCTKTYGGRPSNPHLVYSAVKRMVCYDCESMIQNFFEKGKFKHTCSHCGEAVTHCLNCRMNFIQKILGGF